MSTPDLPLELSIIADSHTHSVSTPNKHLSPEQKSSTPPLVKLKLKPYDSLKINIIKETISHSHHSNHSRGHTPLTPLEYDDKLEYTPPSLNHLNNNTNPPIDHSTIDYHHNKNNTNHTFRSHKPEFSLTMPSQSHNSTNTIKTRLTLDNQETSRVFNIEPIFTNHSTTTNTKSPNDKY